MNESQFPFTDDPIAQVWLPRTKRADDYYQNWSDKFKCDTLEEYFYGFQWQCDGMPSARYDRYVINYVFSTLEIKKPSILFKNIAFRVKPKPANAEFDFMSSAVRARNREDALNTVVSDPEVEFNEEVEQFIVDAFFRFGVMEVGYSANWIENPNAGKPILKSDNDPYADADAEDNILREPPELPKDEQIYFKRILPWRFRVGGQDGTTFKKCSWVGYYDYFRLEDLKANKKLKNLDKLEQTGSFTTRSEDFNATVGDGQSAESEEDQKNGDLVKCWVIYDLRKKEKLIIAALGVTLLKKKWKNLPLVSLKFVEKLRGWYPVPLVYNWKHPQDEINEARDQQRAHRRRARRIYLMQSGTFATDEEIAKIEDGPDMTLVTTEGPPADKIKALENAPLDNIVAQDLITSDADINKISGTPGDHRGSSDRTTATQASIVDQRAQLRETRTREQIANALVRIGRLTLITIQEHFTSAFWIAVRTNQGDEDFMSEFKTAQDEWKQLTAGELGKDLDFDVSISLDTVSPLENDASKKAFVEFLSILTNFPQLAFDPVLVREAAYRCNYRNEKVIARMAQMAMIAQLGQMAAAKASLEQQAIQPGGGPGGPGGNAAQTRVEQMAPPDQGQIQTQLAGQLQ
jgi:hypothetical protein